MRLLALLCYFRGHRFGKSYEAPDLPARRIKRCSVCKEIRRVNPRKARNV